ncbi:MAG: protein-L-isoaspartate(D-aspartate) O-methyltransferase [Halobacteriales archaeon]|nr:protein-L-isoaspartate(D-aspartate) O-methyltransferase [Halobacteriales archaeon]
MSHDGDRERLVNSLVERGYVESEAVEKAMRAVPRENFVPESAQGRAYEDSPLSIGEGQTISAPHMVAMITERLNLRAGDKTLEVGTGRGYHAAVVAEIVGAENVYTVERHQKLAREARENLPDGVTVVTGDGSKGLPAHAPYDRIYLTCASPDVPEFLEEQLRDDGRAVLPVQRGGVQNLTTVEKTDGELVVDEGEPVRFVRLVGDEGF